MPTKKPNTRRPRGDSAATDPTSNAALLALPKERAEAPDMPVAVAVVELKALAKLTGKHSKTLKRLGITDEQIRSIAKFPVRLAALENDWQVRRSRTLSSGAMKKQREQADDVKRKLLAAGEWACRNDKDALAELAAIREGTGIADTIQDLADLAAFWEARAAALANTKVTASDVRRASELATSLDEAAVDEASDTEASQSYALRNRCFWAASALADELRAGGRYAFNDEPAVASRFVSRYRASVSRRARRAKDKKKPGEANPSA